jgi:hypothetical protein
MLEQAVVHTPWSSSTIRKKMNQGWDAAHIVEHLPSKHEALSTNSSLDE